MFLAPFGADIFGIFANFDPQRCPKVSKIDDFGGHFGVIIGVGLKCENGDITRAGAQSSSSRGVLNSYFFGASTWDHQKNVPGETFFRLGSISGCPWWFLGSPGGVRENTLFWLRALIAPKSAKRGVLGGTLGGFGGHLGGFGR